MKVNFMVIGAMKCATTTLSNILANHPQINFCSQKEPHFFSNTPDWRASLDKYHSLFDFNNLNKLLGEGSTSYTMLPRNSIPVWKNLYEYNPDLKFIYIVRPLLSS